MKYASSKAGSISKWSNEFPEIYIFEKEKKCHKQRGGKALEI